MSTDLQTAIRNGQSAPDESSIVVIAARAAMAFHNALQREGMQRHEAAAAVASPLGAAVVTLALAGKGCQ